jgi:hypothetical protein
MTYSLDLALREFLAAATKLLIAYTEKHFG